MMLAGFEDPSGGEILLSGRPLNRVPPYKRNIGMVFQNYALFPHMTVEGNLAYPLKLRSMSRQQIRDKVDDALRLVGLEQMRDRRPAQLSGGQQQRVALARALVFEPQIVLMDEPLGALDKQLREHMQLEIKRIHNRLGLTVVYVTHDQGEALTMSDRIAVFNGGKIRQIGSAADIYEQPTDPFVSGFIGENNTLLGKVEEVRGEECRVRLADGSRIVATRISLLKPGDAACLSIRPERLVLGEKGSGLPNHVRGRVEERIYFGDQIRLGIKVFDDQTLVVKVPVSDIVTTEPKETLEISWDPRFCRAFAAEC
jgi:putative spermidine/putrescine transport system ATP-binding protein